MVYGYADNLNDDLDVSDMYRDHVTVDNKNRYELDKLLAKVQSGDTIVVKSLCQLSWQLKMLIKVLLELSSINVNIMSISESIDTSNPIVIKLLRALNQIKSHNLEIIKSTKWKPKKNIQVKFDKALFELYYHGYKNKSIKIKDMCKVLNISIATTYRLIKRFESKKLL